MWARSESSQYWMRASMYSSHEPGTSSSGGSAAMSVMCTVAITSARRRPHSGWSSSATLRVRLIMASPSTRSITMAGLPSSSPVGSNQRGTGIGTWPDA